MDSAAGKLATSDAARSASQFSLRGNATANVLRAVDPEQVNEVMMSLLIRVRSTTRKPGEQEHVALDGKTLRGTQKHQAEDQKKMHQVCLYETRTGIVLKEQVVKDKESEQTRVEEFLTPLYLKGRI